MHNCESSKVSERHPRKTSGTTTTGWIFGIFDTTTENTYLQEDNVRDT